MIGLVALRRRSLLPMALLVGCTGSRELTLTVSDGPLFGPVEVTLAGNFERLGLMVDGFSIAGGEGPLLSTEWDTREVEPGEHVLGAIGFQGDHEPVEVAEPVIVDQGAGDTVPPRVTFLTPTAGETLPGDSILIVVDDEDEAGIAAFGLLANGVPLASIPPEGPYELVWSDVANGDYVLEANATDVGDNIGQAPLPLTVSDLEPVECNISKPEDEQDVSGDVEIKVGAGSQAGISTVEFFVNDTSIGIDDASTWSWSWTSDPYIGEDVLIRVTCAAADGGEGTDQITVHVVEASAKGFAVTISQPLDGYTIDGAAYPVKARIGGGTERPERAELYVDDVLVAEDTASDWEFFLDTTALSNASHTLKVIGYESVTGLVAEDEVTVTVDN
jgi:hypothetical protein